MTHRSNTKYDAIGRLTKTLNPLGFETRYRYDANGNLTCVIDPNGASSASDAGHQPLNTDGCTESRQYDELNRLKQSKDAQNNVTAYAYDLLGNRTRVTDAEGRTTTFNYDDLGRLTEIVDPLVETPTDKTVNVLTDEAGNVYQETDRKGQVMRFTYDDLNRLTRTDYADGRFAQWTYDGFGDRVLAIQSGEVTYTYQYDRQHRLTAKTDSSSGKTLYWAYDAVGNLSYRSDWDPNGSGIAYQYDSTDRLVAETSLDYLNVSQHG